MEHQTYCTLLERHFQKSEYISVGAVSVKMLTAPTGPIAKDYKLFCFVVNSQEPSQELCTKLVKYALSVTFYDDPSKHGKVAVIPLFVSQSISDNCSAFIRKKAQKINGVAVLPAAFDLSGNQLLCCEKFPALAGGAFRKISDFAKKLLRA